MQRIAWIVAGGAFIATAGVGLHQLKQPVVIKGPTVPNDYMYLQRAGPAGVLDIQAQRQARGDAFILQQSRGVAALRATARPWRLKGPTNVGGRITDIVGDPQNPARFYVGSASGGVWKTVDGGATFVPIFDNAGSLSTGALAVDPTDADVLYVGTGESNPGGGSVATPGDGVWKTTDGGQSWTQLGLQNTRYIGRIAVDPSEPQVVFVAALGNLFSTNPERGLYRSRDGGATWTQVLVIDARTGVVDVAIDPQNTRRIFAASWERLRSPQSKTMGGPGSGIWRSEDSGDTWTELTSGLPPSSSSPGRIGLAMAPATPNVVYAVYADTDGRFEGFYRSSDSGDTWTRRSASGLQSGSFYSTFGW